MWCCCAAQNFLVQLLGTCEGLGMRVPDMRRGVPEELIIHMDQRESVGVLLERAAEAAHEFFNKPPQLLFVCMNARGRPLQQVHLGTPEHRDWPLARGSSAVSRKLSVCRTMQFFP